MSGCDQEGHPGAGPSPYTVQATVASPPQDPRIGSLFAVSFPDFATPFPASLPGHVPSTLLQQLSLMSEAQNRLDSRPRPPSPPPF